MRLKIQNATALTTDVHDNLRHINEGEAAWSASVWGFTFCHARKISNLRGFMVYEVESFISSPNIVFD